MATEIRRRTPDEYLRECEVEEQAVTAAAKGNLKVFLGYASGVGKSFRMLDEARRRQERGQDVVVGAIQAQVSAEVEPLLARLEVIPLKAGNAIDMEAVIRRRPAVCIIDGLAYDNPLGFRNAARWQDVKDILEAGIHVIGSINVQYIAELRERVEAITQKPVSETVPLSFIQSADEIELVDAPPPEADLDSAAESVQEHTERLSRLRELALVVTADIVDQQLNEYLERHGIQQRFGSSERIMVCITPRANLREMMELGHVVAERFHGELVVAYVKQRDITQADQSALEARLAIANAAGVHVEILEGSNPAQVLLDFARQRGVTQLFVGHSQRTGLARLRGSPLDKLIWEGHGIDVCIFPQ